MFLGSSLLSIPCCDIGGPRFVSTASLFFLVRARNLYRNQNILRIPGEERSPYCAETGVRCWSLILNFLVGYPFYRHLYGAQLHDVQVGDQEYFPLPDGALERIRHCLPWGVLGIVQHYTGLDSWFSTTSYSTWSHYTTYPALPLDYFKMVDQGRIARPSELYKNPALTFELLVHEMVPDPRVALGSLVFQTSTLTAVLIRRDGVACG